MSLCLALSGLPESSFRFIVEDAVAFVRREIRRGFEERSHPAGGLEHANLP